MAFLEQRGGYYRLIFKFDGKRYSHSLHTTNRRLAEAVRGNIDRTILQMRQRLLLMPADADPKQFILAAGQVAACEPAPEPTANGNSSPIVQLTLQELRDKYLAALGVGAVEDNTLCTIAIHLRHLERTLGAYFPMKELSLSNLQDHVIRRADAKGIRKRPLSPATLRKEIASLRAAWNWALQAKFLDAAFPNKGLKFPKSTERPPFQTWAEIERQIGQSMPNGADEQDLWDCLFLGPKEISELLAFVKTASIQPWVYPMFCFAAHTGARRSEIIRARIADLDLETAMARIHEKKRVHGHCTSRRVPLSGFLAEVLREWLAVHPGGPVLFAQAAQVFRSKKKRTQAMAITRDEAQDHFKRTLADSKWKVLRGWHVLRHSFCSCCAAKGVDQRLINSWVGHQTEEMVLRYRHLFPAQEKQAIQGVFS